MWWVDCGTHLWAYLLISTTLIVAFFAAGGPGSEAAANINLSELNDALENNLIKEFEDNLIYFHGICALSQGYLLTSMIYAALLVYVIDRQFLSACAWAVAAAILSMIGLIHAYELTPLGLVNKFGLWAAPQFAVAYWVAAALLLILHLGRKSRVASRESE